jgi:hypothetical protein
MTDWHKNEDVYTKKAQGENLIGFQKVWTPQSGGQVVSKEDLLSHADFGKVMYKWHSKTNAVSTISFCLEVYSHTLTLCTIESGCATRIGFWRSATNEK